MNSIETNDFELSTQRVRKTITSTRLLCSDEQGATDFTNTTRTLFALIAVLFAATRLWNFAAYGLFSDEVFTAQTVSLSWSDMIGAVIYDVVHPPLFYVLLKAWISIGASSLVWMKLFPVAVSIASIIPFYLLCRELKLKPATTNLALYVMAINEYMVGYAQELRMYSLLLLLTITSLWVFAKFVNAAPVSKQLLIALFAVNLLLVYTHYYGWLIIAVEFLFLLISRRDRVTKFSLSFAGLIVCFAPWAFLVTKAAIGKGGLGPNLNWNGRPKLFDLVWYYAILNGPVYNRLRPYAMAFATVLFIAPILFWAWQSVRKREAKESVVFRWLMLLSVLPAVITFVASQILPQSVWGIRFLIIVAPSYLLLLSIAAMRLRPVWLRTLTASLMILWAALSGGIQLANRDKIAWEPLVRRMIQAEPDKLDLIKVYTKQGVTATTIQYYLDSANEKQLRVEYPGDYTETKDEHFWVAFLKYEHEHNPLPPNDLVERGYKVGDAIEADAPGHKVFLLPVWRH
ncbi:MAG: glycosyltransferase family 39 protein [Blastocatellia bacterium]